MESNAGRVNSTVVNILTKDEIDGLVHSWFTSVYEQSRGVARKNGLSHPTPFIVKVNGHLYAHAYAFSATKSGSLMDGYPTFPFKPIGLASLEPPPSTTKKSSWVPRLPVHSVLYRWHNDCRLIPDGADISHLRNDGFLVNPDEPVAEDGVMNRSRSACFKYGWFRAVRDGCPSKTCLRCPHMPNCLEPVERPPLDAFSDSDLKPIGMEAVRVGSTAPPISPCCIDIGGSTAGLFS